MRKPLDRIGFAEIQDYVAIKKGLSKKTINNHLTALRRLLVVAKKRQLIEVLPEIEAESAETGVRFPRLPRGGSGAAMATSPSERPGQVQLTYGVFAPHTGQNRTLPGGYDLGDGVASNGQGSIFVARGIIRAIDANNHRSDDAFVTRSDSSLCAQ